jgi:hypothetical protein
VIVIALGAPESPPWWSLVLLGVRGARDRGAAVRPTRSPTAGRRCSATGRSPSPSRSSPSSRSARRRSIAFSDRADPRQVERRSRRRRSSTRSRPPWPCAAPTHRSSCSRSPIARSSSGAPCPLDGGSRRSTCTTGSAGCHAVTLRPIGDGSASGPTDRPGRTSRRSRTTSSTSATTSIWCRSPAGRSRSTRPVETDVDRVAVRLVEPPERGRTVSASSMVAPSIAAVSALDGARFVRRPVDEISQTFADQARELAGEGDLLQQLRTIESTMRTDWVLDRDTSGGGQQLALLERFVSETRRGTREQFVTAFVLFARALGVDARVATGFVIPPESLASPVVVESVHAAAWPEVRLDDDPDEARSRDRRRMARVRPGAGAAGDRPTTKPTPPHVQSPAAAQPPIQPPADDSDDDDERTVEAGRRSAAGARSSPGRSGSGRRRDDRAAPADGRGRDDPRPQVAAPTHRLRHPDPAHRVRGAWANVTDALVDAGLTIGPAWTDDRIARGAAPLAPSAPHELRRLAAMATAMTFGDRRRRVASRRRRHGHEPFGGRCAPRRTDPVAADPLAAQPPLAAIAPLTRRRLKHEDPATPPVARSARPAAPRRRPVLADWREMLATAGAVDGRSRELVGVSSGRRARRAARASGTCRWRCGGAAPRGTTRWSGS